MLVSQVLQLLNSPVPISLEEKGHLIQLMHDPQMRLVMGDILKEVTSPKQVASYECLRLLADVIKFVLTCKGLVGV